ncbi:hypothetical protein B0T25DRAFT_623934 [Lasiosphaeria hispida]|uniref:Cyclochlorotine biosynthesis protein O n=1 Tax=Lasiosphaeria hispida TaxID=260671 RepID=A0AAJ0HE07_9PEZI|nr:hypothetical protein B0T25DRAFT_623934 [Lasiosphaeria hispida]
MKSLQDLFAPRSASPVKYDPVGDDESDNDASPTTSPISRGLRFLSHPSVFALQTLTILFLAAYSIKLHYPSDLACARQLSPYSPYLESEDLRYVEFMAQNHLMQPSPYRGRPTPEIEESWLKLWRVPTIHLPETKLAALNKTPASDYTHVSPEYGGGVMGFLDVFHQLHCLNLVRQYTYRDEYDYSNVTAFRAPREIVRGHIDHCIETVRKAIMCTADVTPVLFTKDPHEPSGRSDFNIKKKCRDFARVQEWAWQNQGFPG